MDKDLKVLMLGWEFPPVINGGLGIACLGLAKAMRHQVDLSIILPKSEPSFIIDNVELIGLNNLTIEEVTKYQTTSTEYAIFDKVDYIDANILPYGDSASGEVTEESIVLKKQKVLDKEIKNQLNAFKFGDLYGDDVIEKVKRYANYASNLADSKEFDIIWAHDWMTYLAGIEIKKKTGKPLVVHVHATTYDRGGKDARGWEYDVERYGMQEADAIIPVSHYTGQVCVEHFGADANKIKPVHNGVEFVNAYKEEKKFPEKLVLFLGRVTGQKGPEIFLDIADKVLSKNNKIRFVMAGSGDQLKGIIESGAYKHIGDKFHFTGFLNKEKVNRLLAMADIYCMPSVSEPFGLSALEAAQFNIPVILSKQSGAAEVMQGALKTDFWDVDLTAKHILDLASDDQLAKKVAAAGVKDLQNLTWENASEKINSIFNSLV